MWPSNKKSWYVQNFTSAGPIISLESASPISSMAGASPAGAIAPPVAQAANKAAPLNAPAVPMSILRENRVSIGLLLYVKP